ncbi:TPA: hypothetical protein ACXNZZ_004119 [Pseudomonas aeruginosa]
MQKQIKINVADRASFTFHSVVLPSKDTFYFNPPHYGHLLITNNKASYDNAYYMLSDYLDSEQYQEATQKKIHLIDLDEFEHDAVSIKLTKTHKFKPVSSVSKCHRLTQHIAKADQPINNVVADKFVMMAFDEMLQPDDFFKFHEVRTEYRVSISLVKNRKVIKTIKVNMGYLTLITTSKQFDYQECESQEKKATRPSLYNPVYRVDNIEFMATFNDSKSYYRDVVDMLKI